MTIAIHDNFVPIPNEDEADSTKRGVGLEAEIPLLHDDGIGTRLRDFSIYHLHYTPAQQVAAESCPQVKSAMSFWKTRHHPITVDLRSAGVKCMYDGGEK